MSPNAILISTSYEATRADDSMDLDKTVFGTTYSNTDAEYIRASHKTRNPPPLPEPPAEPMPSELDQNGIPASMRVKYPTITFDDASNKCFCSFHDNKKLRLIKADTFYCLVCDLNDMSYDVVPGQEHLNARQPTRAQHDNSWEIKCSRHTDINLTSFATAHLSAKEKAGDLNALRTCSKCIRGEPPTVGVAQRPSKPASSPAPTSSSTAAASAAAKTTPSSTTSAQTKQ